MRIQIIEAQPKDFFEIGQLMIDVYSNLEGFATPKQQPEYYEMLANIGDFVQKESVKLLLAKDKEKILGTVVYIADMEDYGSGGIATKETNASGFRLLTVSRPARGLGIGRKLTNACIEMAKSANVGQVIIHTTESMKVAWGMYEKMGFKRSVDLDFEQNGLTVYGFRYFF
ncbi:GNAT family N-acetyltransferase [Ekhidna sp.]